MNNKIKTISGEEAFRQAEGRTIASINNYRNTVEILFNDGSHITMESTTYYDGCYGHSGDDYCYCSEPEVEVTAYFSEKK